MKKSRMFLSALAALAFSIGMVACSGDDGDQGPAGPMGNANVKSSIITLDSASWSNGNAIISVPEITADIANNGQVSVYAATDSLYSYSTDSMGNIVDSTQKDTVSWHSLPWEIAVQSQSIRIQHTISTGEILLSARTSSNIPINFSNRFYVRVITIPSSGIKAGVDVNNYQEVKEVYGIEEVDLELY